MNILQRLDHQRIFDRLDDAALGIVFLQDVSGSMALGGRLDQGKALLNCLLEERKSVDRFALASFAGGRLWVEAPLTANAEALRESADSWQAYGKTGLHDAVARLTEADLGNAIVRLVAMVVSYRALGVDDLANDSLRVLQLNFPDHAFLTDTRRDWQRGIIDD